MTFRPLESLGPRLTAAAAAAVAAAACILWLGAEPASASSQGCTYTKFPTHYVCFSINGISNYVSSFAVIRGKLDADNDICNHRARVRVTAPSGRTWTYWTARRPGCQIFRVVRSISVRRTYPSGSRACGSFYENGVLQDTACNWIRR
jgi:hypothetical protein